MERTIRFMLLLAWEESRFPWFRFEVWSSSSDSLQSVADPWIETVNNRDFGYTVVETNSTTLHMQFFSNSNVVMDDFYLFKN